MTDREQNVVTHHHEPDIYENIVIGNFLFGLGAEMGWRNRGAPTPPTCASLLQQTPLDEKLGDVLIKNARLIRLVEFKRIRNLSQKELRKRNRLARALASKPANDLQQVSRKVHWYVGSSFACRPERYHIVPYLDFADRSMSPKFNSLGEFVEAIAAQAFGRAPNDNEVEQELSRAENYLVHLQSVWRGTKVASASSGMLCLQITAEGNLRYVALKYIRELSHTVERILVEREHAVERRVELQHPLEQQRRHELEQRHGPEHERGFDHSR